MSALPTPVPSREAFRDWLAKGGTSLPGIIVHIDNPCGYVLIQSDAFPFSDRLLYCSCLGFTRGEMKGALHRRVLFDMPRQSYGSGRPFAGNMRFESEG